MVGWSITNNVHRYRLSGWIGLGDIKHAEHRISDREARCEAGRLDATKVDYPRHTVNMFILFLQSATMDRVKNDA